MRIHKDSYYADIIKDRYPDSGIWHWIIQRRGSAEILYWSQASSKEKATQAASRRLDELVAQTTLKARSTAAC